MAKPSKPKPSPAAAPAGVPLTGVKADKRLLQALRDDVAPEATPAVQFLLDHAKAIASLVVATVLVAVVLIGYHWNHKKNIEEGQIAVADALAKKNGAETISALEALVPGLPSELLVGVYIEIVSRAEAGGNFATAAEYWEKIYNATPDASFKTVAGLGWAKNLVALSRLEDARGLLEKLTKESGGALLYQVEMEQALLAEKMGDLKKSLAIYQDLLSKNTQFSEAFLSAQAEELGRKLAERAPAEQAK